MVYRWAVIGVALLLLVVGFQGERNAAFAQRPDKDWICKVISVQGRVLVKRQGDAGWQVVGLNDVLSAGDQIRVEANSRAGIVLSNDAVLRLDQNTTLAFAEIEKETTFIFKLLRGAANFFSRRARSLKIFTPFVNGVVEGTEFYVRVDADQTRIDLFEGRILAQNDHGELHLVKSQGATAMAGTAPQRRLLAKPRDSVQWALYYPPILALGPGGDMPVELRDALEDYHRGRRLKALGDLEQIEPEGRNSRFYTFRAAMLLHQGSISQARNDIARALALDSENSEAFALRAVIAVVQNRKEEAMGIARNAVQLNPDSAAAQLALSYAYQAAFDLPNALKAAKAAVANVPEHGTAHARLAELRLSTGRMDEGIQSARKAVALNPNVSHAHTVLGFAYLTQIKIAKAREAFEEAIALDSAAPLPRLGLGLAKIRDGELASGRSDIEIAAGLDPLNALIRSYLGKAYFDEKRGPLDATQFEIAKTLDPNDPTPWFYDAIRKQTLNRPGEALQELQKSIELNDNRAVYRSRLLLDEDLAARSAALGRIYNDLSFQEQALREGAKSLRADPTNFSAHRLLSDTYASRPRHEIAQVSELLQSQLLQPLNLTPVPLQVAESTLVVSEGAGPLSTSFNEFNPLFTRDQLALQLSGAAGNNASRSDEASVSGIYKWLSFSAGRYHYETEGFRVNNDLEKDIYNAFVQTALTPHTSIQLEYRQKEVLHGDLELNFNPQAFSDNRRITRDEKIPRIGFHHVFNGRNHFIGSLIANQTEYTLYEQQVGGMGPGGPIVGTEDRDEEDDAYNGEGQYLYRSDSLNMIVGAGYYKQHLTETVTTLITSGPFTLLNLPDQRTKQEVWHANAYTYALLKFPPKLDVTLGFSADVFSKGEIEPRQVNPKFGFNWYLSPSMTIRGAAFRSLKRSLVTNQTIEPTQVAGFAQFFDDYLATDAKRYGLGLDYQMAGRFYGGAEATFNDMAHPIVNTSSGLVVDEKHDEHHHRLYAYWLAHPQVAVSTEYLFDHYERDPLPADSSRPYKLRTHSLPLTVAYFHPTGLFFKIKGTYFNQHVEKLTSATSPTQILRDDFTLVDTAIGFRLPKRYGVVTFSVNNIFDTDFNFQDTGFLTSNEQEPMIKPVRQCYLKATLRF